VSPFCGFDLVTSSDRLVRHADIHGVPIDEAMRILNKELMLYKEAQAEIARAAAANAFPQGT
jgi:hypothetical protein